MQYSKALVAAALYASSAVAQIAFTSVPASVQAGEDVTLRWSGGDNGPVTITLQNGPAEDLQTVSLITGRATGTSYTFDLPTTLSNGRYAFKISQGQDDVNYSGMFSFSGGSNTPASTSLDLVSTLTSSDSASATSIQAAIASINSTVSSLTAARNLTTTAFVPAGTGASGASGAGTGTVMNRNTTMSLASLRTSATATTTTDSSSTASSTDSSAASTSSSAASPVGMDVASPLALVLSAFMAVVYLG